jgi:hypothetical protein
MHHPGRLVFGLAITGFGIVGLLYVDFLNSLQAITSWLPGYAPLALVNSAALVAVAARAGVIGI